MLPEQAPLLELCRAVLAPLHEDAVVHLLDVVPVVGPREELQVRTDGALVVVVLA